MTISNKSDWVETAEHLEKTYIFSHFVDAISFMLRVGFECEKMNHHPEWTNIYTKVSVTLTTHDDGNKVTAKDRALAKMMDEIFIRFAPKSLNKKQP